MPFSSGSDCVTTRTRAPSASCQSELAARLSDIGSNGVATKVADNNEEDIKALIMALRYSIVLSLANQFQFTDEMVLAYALQRLC
jgi:hypothetical protein